MNFHATPQILHKDNDGKIVEKKRYFLSEEIVLKALGIIEEKNVSLESVMKEDTGCIYVKISHEEGDNKSLIQFTKHPDESYSLMSASSYLKGFIDIIMEIRNLGIPMTIFDENLDLNKMTNKNELYRYYGLL